MRIMTELAACALFATSTASAQHLEVTAALSVEYRPGNDLPFGVRLAASPQVSLAARCGRSGDPTCGPLSIWPIFAPELGVGLHGRTGTFDARLGLGVASVESYHVGWLPYWEVLAQIGAQWQTGRKGVGTLLGGTINKNVSPYFGTGKDFTRDPSGTDGLALRVDVHALLLNGGHTWQIGAGIQSATHAVSEYPL
ncbi:MAG: hypothetical protein ACJATT_000908 [Myxococcota bacterium]|jgi:hypothetical protein